jgi:hypothetical protein
VVEQGKYYRERGEGGRGRGREGGTQYAVCYEEEKMMSEKNSVIIVIVYFV